MDKISVTEPIESIEFHLTEVCNYRCPYCCEGQYNKHRYRTGHASDKVINSVYEFLEKKGTPWHVKLIGGEPFTHPRFMEICENLANKSHKLAFTTNFSYSREKLLKLLDLVGDKLDFLGASLHLSEVKDKNKFIDKAEAFNSNKSINTKFEVTSVLTESNFEELKKVKNELNNRNVNFKFVSLKKNGKIIEYPKYIKEYLRDTNNQPVNEALRNFKSFRTKCFTGFAFFNIQADGSVKRCYNRQLVVFMDKLGNITDPNFKSFNSPMPCLSRRCTCTVPMNRNMIDFNKKYSYVGTLCKIGDVFSNFLRKS